jgi:pimeloyl-ACP methyl ester carboxylesterase
MYVVQFQDSQEPDRIFAEDVGRTFEVLMRKPMPRTDAAAKPNLAFPQIVAAYDAAKDRRPTILSDEEKQVFVEAYTATGFTGGINWYRNITRNWQRSAGLDHMVRVPALMIMAENDLVLPPSMADGMENLVPDLEKHLVRDSGHWTQQEKPDEVSATLIEWRKRRFG